MRSIWNENGSTRTIILAVVFVVLLIATISKSASKKRVVKERIELESVALVDVNTDDIYTIEIQELLSKTVLAKRDGKWWVGAAQTMPNMSEEEKEKEQIKAWDYADEDAVLQVLETVQEGFNNWELVSVNRERMMDYRIGALGSKFSLLDENGNELACFDVGEKAANFTGTYIAICGEDKVYKIPGLLDMIFKRDAAGWRTKVIYELEQDDVVRFEINDPNDKKPVVLEKDDDGNWVGSSPYDFIPGKKKVSSLLAIFCNYKAMGFPERMRPGEDSIQTTTLDLTATMKDGKVKKLTFGTTEQARDTLVMDNERGILYTANYMDVDNLNMKADYLAEPDKESEESE
jgi:hypothetical protein